MWGIALAGVAVAGVLVSGVASAGRAQTQQDTASVAALMGRAAAVERQRPAVPPLACPGGTVTDPGGAVAGLTAEQTGNAATIIAVGKALSVPPQGWVVALAAARQESGFRADLTEADSDRDSAGLFQQRRAWAPGGSEAYRMNPVNASRMFYTGGAGGQRGLLDIPGWQSMSVAEAAQAVQVSAFPDAYAQWETLARQLVVLLGQVDPAQLPPPGGCAPVAVGSWTQPLAKGSYSLSSPYGMRVHPITGVLKLHDGTDLAAPCGTPVVAAAGGTVVVEHPSAYGTLVTVRHGDGTWTQYGHMPGATVDTGAAVKPGQQIAEVGSAGMSTGCHLHFIVRPDGGATTDPAAFMAQHGAPL